MQGQVHIGTSGWSYPHWKSKFYPDGLPETEQLNYYIRHFNTVEINRTFYRLPTQIAVADWYNSTPDDFIFAVKGSRFTTHNKKLKDPVQSSERFFEAIEPLAGKTGAILFQLPPGWQCNFGRLEAFTAILPERYRYAFEFRHHSWYQPEVYELLEKNGMAFVIYDLAGHTSPLQVTADFVYLRLHGPSEAKYAGLYSQEDLQVWQSEIEQWRDSGRDVFVYFDNDESAFAPQNAIELKEMLLT